MKMTKFVGLALGLALILSGNLSAQTNVQFITEGYTGGNGKIDDYIAAMQKDVGENPDPSGVAVSKYRLEKWSAIKVFLNKAGLTAEGLDWGWAESLTQKQVQSALAKFGPDVWVGETQMPGFAAQGLLEPFPASLEKKVRETLVPGSYTAMEYKGKLYGVSPTPSVNILFWNKDLLRKAGLDPDKAPTTWAELKANADKVTAAGAGKFFGGGAYVGPHFGGSLRYYSLILANGGDILDASQKPTLNTDKVVSAVQWIKDLNKNMPVGLAGDPDEGAYFTAFNQGKIAYIIDGTWRRDDAVNNKIDVGYSLIPVKNAGDKPVNVGIGMPLFGVPTYAKNKVGGFKFIEALIDTKVQATDAKFGIRPAVLKSLAYDQDYLNSYYGMFYQVLQGTVKGMPTFAVQNAKVYDLFHNAVTQSVTTNGDIKKILTDAQTKAIGLK